MRQLLKPLAMTAVMLAMTIMTGCMVDTGATGISLCPQDSKIPSLTVAFNGGSASCVR